MTLGSSTSHYTFQGGENGGELGTEVGLLGERNVKMLVLLPLWLGKCNCNRERLALKGKEDGHSESWVSCSGASARALKISTRPLQEQGFLGGRGGPLY